MRLFGLSKSDAMSRRARVCAEVDERVTLPEYGAVRVQCRLICTGQSCPKPQLLALKALRENPVGCVVEVITDNLAAVETISAMMDNYASQHLGTLPDNDCWRVYVRRED
jgi:tRNA 2-thiouridine synthesizing protein A